MRRNIGSLQRQTTPPDEQKISGVGLKVILPPRCTRGQPTSDSIYGAE